MKSTYINQLFFGVNKFPNQPGEVRTVVGIAERPLLRVADLKDMARPSETWLWMGSGGRIPCANQEAEGIGQRNPFGE